MKIAITGKPNTGKSTLFKALSEKDIDIANYPFTTIDTNRAIAYATQDCPCNDFDKSCDPNTKCKHGKRYIPVSLLDVAGLVPGASEGKGMGNEFLDSIREASALVNVIDISGGTNEKGEPTEDYDPGQDLEFIPSEFDSWLESIMKDNWNKYSRKIHLQDLKIEEFLADKFSGLGITNEVVNKAILNLGLDRDPENWNEGNFSSFVTEVRKLSKPMVYVCNKIDLPKATENLERIRQNNQDKIFIPTSAEAELALSNASRKGLIDYAPGESDFEILKESEMSDKQIKGLEKIRENVLEKYGSTGVQKALNKVVFDLLDLIAVYPVEDQSKLTDQKGNVLPDVVLLPKGSTPVDLAYKIHEDIGDNYIKAVDARTDRTISKDKELENRDVIKIVT